MNISPISFAKFQRSLQLDERQIGPVLSSCPFCNSNDINETGIEIYKEPSIYLLGCKSCKSSFAARMPTEEALHIYYSNYYERLCDGPEKQATAVTHGNTRRFAMHIARLFLKYSEKKSVNILDFGGGDGSLGVEVKNALISSGREINLFLIDIANVKPAPGCIKLPNLDCNIKHNFDLVLASAVLEHLISPLQYLKELALKSTLIYFRTPFIKPLIYLADKFSIPIDFTYPGHVSDLGPEFYFNLSKCLPEFKIELLYSNVSPVATSFKQSIIRTGTSHLLKFPYRILRYFRINPCTAVKIWPYVGGWEAFVRVVK